MTSSRIELELALLREGGVNAEYHPDKQVVLYRDVPTMGAALNLPGATNIVVPVPGGYPAAAIDLGGLPSGSPLIGRVKGAPNGPLIDVEGQQYQLMSFHPFGNEGGAWNPNKHGFHTYYGWIRSWLARLN